VRPSPARVRINSHQAPVRGLRQNDANWQSSQPINVARGANFSVFFATSPCGSASIARTGGAQSGRLPRARISSIAESLNSSSVSSALSYAMAYHRGSDASSGDDEQRWNGKVNFAVNLRRVSRADSSFVFFAKFSTFVLIKLSEKCSEAAALHPFHDV
jgi:hypothetical protein